MLSRRHLSLLVSAATLVAPMLAVAPAQAAVFTATGVRCTVVGTAGADVLVGTSGTDVICGLAGNDVLRGGGGNDVLDAGAGSDRVVGGPGGDTVVAGGGSDTVDAGPGKDRVVGGPGGDTIAGGPGADALVGGDQNDVVRGGTGRDRISGGAGADRVLGGDQSDTLLGGTGGDDIAGGLGDDVVDGGGAGDDLAGNGGDDELTSGPGSDSVDGGTGDNLCIVDAADESVRCRYDEQPPVAVETTVAPGTVDVTHRAAQVTVRVHATDDTGVRDVQGYLAAGDNGVAIEIGGFALVAGTDRDGWWEATATVPRWTPPGTVYPQLWVTDRQRRSVLSEGRAAPLEIVDADPDTDVPQLTLTELTPAAIDVRTAARTVTATLRAVDSQSGVDRFEACLSRPGTPTTYNQHPLFQEVACASPTRVSGTIRDGVWTVSWAVPKGSVGATYNVVASVADRAGNGARWSGPDDHQEYVDGNWCCTPAYAFPDEAGRVEVTGTVADQVSAWIDEVTASKTELDTLAADDTTRVRVHALDAIGEGEGVTAVEAVLVSDGSYASDPGFDQASLTLVSGTVTDGWWEGDVVAPQGTPPGTYHLLVQAVDRAHGTWYTDPAAPGADGVTYQPLAGVPTITVVDSRP